jgi:hypothetical protein
MTDEEPYDPRLKYRCPRHPKKAPRWIIPEPNPKTGRRRPPICAYCAEAKAAWMRKVTTARRLGVDPEDLDD